jgi:hypothetical protein
MPEAIVNGRRINVPGATTDAEIRRLGGIRPGRTLIRRDESGSYVVPEGSVVDVESGDVFADAPKRVKG